MSEEWLRGRLQEEKDNAKQNLAKEHSKGMEAVKKLDELQRRYNHLKEDYDNLAIRLAKTIAC